MHYFFYELRFVYINTILGAEFLKCLNTNWQISHFTHSMIIAREADFYYWKASFCYHAAEVLKQREGL